MDNKCHVFRRPTKGRTYIALFMMICLVIILASPNIAVARSNTQWPKHYDGTEYTDAEKPKHPQQGPQYFYNVTISPKQISEEDVKINLTNYDEVDKTLKNEWLQRHRKYFELSCFGKFVLREVNYYGMIGYLPKGKNDPYKDYMPYIYERQTNVNFKKEGYAYHFFDYPGDGGKDGIDHDFSFSFRGEFDKILQEAAKKANNLEVNIVAEVYDTEGDHAHLSLDFTFKNNYYEYFHEKIKLGHTGKNGRWVTWYGQWQYVPADAIGLRANFFSTEGKGADANDAEIMLPRVLIRDINPPAVKSVEIQASEKFTKSTNSVYDGKNTRYRAKVGDVIEYVVTFDEPVKLTDKNVKLQIVSTKGPVYAELDETKSKLNTYEAESKFYFRYTLKEDDGVVESGRVEKIINADKFVDVGKNPVKTDNNSRNLTIPENKYINVRSGSTKELNVIIDSSTPDILEDAQNAEGGFYALKMSEGEWGNKQNNVVLARSAEGGIPSGLKFVSSGKAGDGRRQDTVFSLNSGKQAIFRIALSDMIDEKLLKMSNDSDPLKLKLNIFNSNGTIVGNAYAELIAYRYMNQTFVEKDTNGYQGTNEGYTELFFAYAPKASDFQGMPADAYKVDIAAQVKDGYFIFDTDLFNKQLSDFAGNKIGQLKCVLSNPSQKAPANMLVMIDLAPPVLVEYKYPSQAKPVKELSGIELVFEEKGEAAGSIKVTLQIFKESINGGVTVKKPVDTKLGGKDGTNDPDSSGFGGAKKVSTAAKQINNTNKYKVEISNLSIYDPTADISDRYYLVYEVYDEANNSSTNIDTGIPVKIDILPPQPVMGEDGKWYTVERTQAGETAYVTFNLEDASGLADNFTYYTVDYNDSATSVKRGDNRLNTSTSKNATEITTDKDTRTSLTVWTKFRDILGNEMEDYIPAGPISFDTRRIDAEYYCINCVGSGYRKTYDLRVKIKNPFSEIGSGKEGTLKVIYKWVSKDKENDDSVEFEEILITGNSKEAQNKDIIVSLTPEGFQQAWLKKLKKDGSAFQGKYLCYTKVELWSEIDGKETLINYIDLGWHQHYFDNMPPAILFKQFSGKYAKNPVIAFQIDDDGGESNIDFDNTYYTYAVRKKDASGDVRYVDISEKYPIYTSNYLREETGLGGINSLNGKIVGIDETEIYVKVTVQDKAGNKTEEVSSNPVLIDSKAPVVSKLALNIKDEAKNISYKDQAGDYTIVRNLTDITGVTLNVADNTNSTVTVTGNGGSKAVLTLSDGVYSGTMNLTQSDFTYVERTMGGADHYCATLAIADEGGNITYSDIHVIVDNMAVYSITPAISISSNNDEYTPENVIARQYIYINDYETAEILKAGLSLTDPEGKVSGEPVIVIGSDGINYIELALSKNTSDQYGPSDVYITITDALGNVSEKIYFTAKGIDYEGPAITVTPSPENNEHDGTFIIEASDNEYLDRIDVALTKKGAEPEEEDYFTSVWPSSALLADEYTSEDIGYAPSYAYLDVSSRSDKNLNASFYYRCLEKGNYTLHIRVKDGAGNVTIKRIDFSADNKAPEVLEVSYSTQSKTGGSVSVTIKTDQPVILQKMPSNEKTSSVLYYVQDMIRDFMKYGLTYWYDGERKNLSLMDLELRRFDFWLESGSIYENYLYDITNEIVAPIMEDIWGPKDEDLYENDPEYRENYDNQWNYIVWDNWERIDELVWEKYQKAMANKKFDEDLYLFGLVHPGQEFSTEYEELKKMKEILDFMYVGILFGDEYDIRIIDPAEGLTGKERQELIQEVREAIKERVDSYYIADGEETKIDESIFIIKVYGAGEFIGDPELEQYLTINFFKYPEEFDLLESTDPDIKKLQILRKESVELLLELFADIASVDMSYTTEKVITYSNNTNVTLYAVNKYGQAAPVEIRIDNIDPNNTPSLEADSFALVYKDGSYTRKVTELTVKKTEKDKIYFVADNGDNSNLYYYDFRLNGEPLTVTETVYNNLTVGESVYANLIYLNPMFVNVQDTLKSDFPDFDSMEFYQSVEAALNGRNGLITFKYLDLTFIGVPGKIYSAESSYSVNVFDDEPPTGTILYDIDPGSPTNKDIVATVINIKDNRSDESAIKVYYEDDSGVHETTTYTFTDNGEVTFTLEDYAGNKAYLKAKVTGIDREPPKIEGKFYIDGMACDVEKQGDKTYKYKGLYINQPVTAKVIDSETGKIYSTHVFDKNETVTAAVYDAAGNYSTIELVVDKFDFTPPAVDTNSIKYYVDGAEFTGASTNKNVTVRFKVTDDNSPVIITGLYMKIEKLDTKNGVAVIKETVTDDTGKVKPVAGSPGEYEIVFEYNGKADIYFTDEAGNQSQFTIIVDMIDKVPPPVRNEFRNPKKVPVNEPVTVAVYPDEACYGWITDNKGNLVTKKEDRGYSMAPLTYTFNEENDGDSNMLWFHFEDLAGNKIEYQVTAFDIDMTKPNLSYRLLALNKAVPRDKVLPVGDTDEARDEAIKQLIDYPGAVTYVITADSMVTSKGTQKDQFTGGIIEGDTIEILNRTNAMYHTFMKNGDYEFFYRDQAGNANSLIIPVDCIDDNKPGATVTYSPDKSAGYTNKDVVITIDPYDIDAKGQKTNNAYVYWNRNKYTNNGSNIFTYTVTENGNYQFIVMDDSGNTATINVTVDWIDKEAPVIQTKGPIWSRLGINQALNSSSRHIRNPWNRMMTMK